jgi:hypothetical protein
MKKFLIMAAASGLALAAATPADAALFISYSTNGGVTKTALNTGSGSITFNGNVGDYTLNLSATGMPILASPNFSTNSISVQSGRQDASQLILYFTQTDQSAYNGALNSAFSVTQVFGAAQSVNLASFFSAANANGSLTGVAPGTLLDSRTFTTGGFTSDNDVIATAGLFSTTAVYTINFGEGANGRVNAGVDVTAAVPEPATWAMMIMGFGLVGGVMRRRSTKVAFA